MGLRAVSPNTPQNADLEKLSPSKHLRYKRIHGKGGAEKAVLRSIIQPNYAKV